MNRWLPTNLRSRLTFWYVAVLGVLLLLYATIVFIFQYAVLTRQIVHDEVQDVVTVEGLLFFDSHGALKLRQDYYSRPQSHLLIDRLMEVRDLSGNVLYRSPTLNGMALGGPLRKGEGESSANERVVRLADGSHVLLISHIHEMSGRVLLIRLGYSLAPLRGRMFQFLWLLLIAIPLALVVAGSAGHAVAKRGLRPLEKMTAKAEKITASNLHDRLEVVNQEDELGHMAQVFNHLLDRLEQAFLQLQRFTADAAHELRTPLASLRTIGEVALEKGRDSQEYEEALANILEETARLDNMISSLFLLAKAEASQPGNNETVFLAKDLVDEILNLLQIVIEEKQLTVLQENEAAGHAQIKADRSLLRIAVLNVLHNALKFAPDGSVLRIAYALLPEPVPMLRVAIQDEGPGIIAGEHEQVFERFFTSSSRTTASKSGTGLGLSIARLVISRLLGTIHFDEKQHLGAKCMIDVPVYRG